jgi:hypothetical protein
MLAATMVASVGALGVLVPAAPAFADDEVSATVKQVGCNPDGTASIYWNLHNTFNGEARFDVLRSTQGTLKFTTPPKTYQGNVLYIVLDGGATMVVYVTLVVPSPPVSLETDFYWPTGPEAGFSVTGNPPVQPPATCPKTTRTSAAPTNRAPTNRASSAAPTSVAASGPTLTTATSSTGVDGIAGGTFEPVVEPQSGSTSTDRTTGTVVALIVGLLTLVLLGGGVWFALARRRAHRP